MVSKASTGPFRGDDIINDTGLSQTTGKRGRVGVDKTFYVRVENDGPADGTFTIGQADFHPSGLRTTYFFRGFDVTTAMKSGMDVDIASGDFVTVRVVQRFTRSFPPGTIRGIPFVGLWEDPGTGGLLGDLARIQLNYNT
jgi:hypothetical protein